MLFRIVLYAPILGIGGVIRVLNTDSSMTWILGLAVGLILVVIIVLFQVAMPKFTVLQTLVDKLNLVTREILTGIPVIRAFSREKHEEERFEEANAKTDKDKPVCQQMYDLYDADDDADHERRFCTDHLQRSLCGRQRNHAGW